jgi:tRNA nucleotidyltransferase/poly(A) polymerase
MQTETASPLAKVQLINDINHNWHKLSGRNIDTEEFDDLYAKTEDQLEDILIRIQMHMHAMKQMQELAEIAAKHMNAWAQKMKGPEDQDNIHPAS